MKKKVVGVVVFLLIAAIQSGCGKDNNNAVDLSTNKIEVENDSEFALPVDGTVVGSATSDDSDVLTIPYSELIDHWKLISVESEPDISVCTYRYY